MKFSFSVGKVDLSEMDKERLGQKLERLKKHLRPPYEVTVKVDRDTHHRKGEVMTCRVHIVMAGQQKAIYADKAGETLESACDEAIEVVERNLRQAHDKSKQKR